jgi:hypothetical protein
MNEHGDSRAGGWLARWTPVITGMLSGALTIGSRTPVRGLPAWVTPEVTHGGFATGGVQAGGPLQPWEIGYANQHAIAHDRATILKHQVEQTGAPAGYRVRMPEESVLLVVGWLIGAGDPETARRLLTTIAPFARKLRFAPEPAEPSAVDPQMVWREPVTVVRHILGNREPNARVETMRATLTVWNLYADRMLDLWLRIAGDRASGDGWVGVPLDDETQREARALLDEFSQLASRFPPSRRHAGPKANLTVLRTALEDLLTEREQRPGPEQTGPAHTEPAQTGLVRAGLVRTVIDAMVARRGVPGSAEHRALRDRQAADVARPPHHLIAHAVAARLAELPQDTGTTEIALLVAPLEQLPGGPHPLPAPIRAIAIQAKAAPVEELIDDGLVPSAGVLAQLVPRIAAQTVAAAYPDPALRRIMAANYLAFRARRPLLFTGLRSQVRLAELPWVQAVAAHRTSGAEERGPGDGGVEDVSGARSTLRRLGGIALRSFPGTLIPDPVVRELAAVAREAELELPWVEELAADIFDGRFVPQFLAAAKIAGEVLGETVYERYYRIDYSAIAALPEPLRMHQREALSSAAFGELCRERAGITTMRGRPAPNGMVIEQAQILTTHNLATLVQAGVRLAPDGAERCWATAERLARRLDGPCAHRIVKDVAYAWRQMVFHLAVNGGAADFVASRPAGGPLAPALAGLSAAVDGAATDDREGAPLTGWTTERHWLLPPATR